MDQLALVVAAAKNSVIGSRGGLPWPRLAEDMAWFKQITTGHAVIMGRKTWDSLPTRARPLVDRINIVVSKNRDAITAASGVQVVSDPSEAISWAQCIDPMPFVIGGAQVYQAALPMVTRIYFTEIDIDVSGDTFFTFDRAQFIESTRTQGRDPRLQFVVLDRVNRSATTVADS